MSDRSEALARRLEEGARALANFAQELTDAQWQQRMPGDGRRFGVIVDHVANVYPIEIDLALTVSRGSAVTGVTWTVVADLNAAHAAERDAVTKPEALAHLQRSSEAAAAAIRALDDHALDSAAPVSLYGDAPVTCQFMLEDHAVRHSFHHLARLRRVLEQSTRQSDQSEAVVVLMA